MATEEAGIPEPIEIAQDLLRIRDLRNGDPRVKALCDVGLMLFWAANEINNLVLILQPNVQIQDDTAPLSSEGAPQDGEGEAGSPMDADEERQNEGSD